MRQALYAKALGDLILRYEERLSPDAVIKQMESNALSLLEEIRAILTDDTLSDPECFYKIDAMVMDFYQVGDPLDSRWQAD